MYANLTLRKIVLDTGEHRYVFAPTDYYSENTELLPYYENGTLSGVEDTYPTDYPDATEATRITMFVGEPVEDTFKHAVLHGVTGVAQTLIAAVEGKSIQVVGGHLSFGVAAGEVTILDGDSAIDYIIAAVGSVVSILPRTVSRPIWKTTVGNALKVTTQVTQTISGTLEFIEV